MRGYLWHEEWWPVIEIRKEGGPLTYPERCYEIPDELWNMYLNAVRVHEEAQEALREWARSNGKENDL